MKDLTLKKHSISKFFLNASLSQFGVYLSAFACLIVNLIFVGKFLDSDSLTALGFLMPLLMLFFSISSSIAAGIQSTCGYYVGANKTTYAQKCFNAGMVVFLVIVCAISIICILCNHWIAIILGAVPGDVSFNYLQELIIILALGAPGMMLTQTLLLIVLTDSGKKLPVIAAIVLFISNISIALLNLFIFKIGIFGIGLATSISFYLATGTLCLYFFKKDCLFKLNLSFKNYKKEYIYKIIRNGLPSAIAQICNAFALWIINILLINFGNTSYIAAASVIGPLSTLLTSFSSSMGSATLVVGNYYYAKRDTKSLKQLMKLFIALSIIVYAIVSVLSYVFSDQLCLLVVNSDTPEFSIASFGIKLYSFCLIFCSINVSFRNFIQSLQKIALTQVICILQNVVFQCIFAAIITLTIDVSQIWYMYVLCQTATLIFILISFARIYKGTILSNSN